MNNLAPMKFCPGVQGNLNWMPGYEGTLYFCNFPEGGPLVPTLDPRMGLNQTVPTDGWVLSFY